MNKKVSLLIVSLFLTMVVFSISTYMQKKRDKLFFSYAFWLQNPPVKNLP